MRDNSLLIHCILRPQHNFLEWLGVYTQLTCCNNTRFIVQRLFSSKAPNQLVSILPELLKSKIRFLHLNMLGYLIDIKEMVLRFYAHAIQPIFLLLHSVNN